jgi:hypothetical protein
MVKPFLTSSDSYAGVVIADHTCQQAVPGKVSASSSRHDTTYSAETGGSSGWTTLTARRSVRRVRHRRSDDRPTRPRPQVVSLGGDSDLNLRSVTAKSAIDTTD